MPRLLAEGEELQGKLLNELYTALLDAFDREELRRMLAFELNKKLERITTNSGMETIVLDVIEYAERGDFSAELLQAARVTKPQNVKLFICAQQFGLAPSTEVLERKIRSSNSMFDPLSWRTRLAELEFRICRIEIHTGYPPEYGTGFLLGPDVVMTNYHVMEKVIHKQVSPGNVILRFDFKTLENGLSVNEGTTYTLGKDDWLLDASPYNPTEKSNPDAANPLEEELDYALLRVANKPGEDLIGKG